MGEGKAKEGEHRLAFHSPGLGKLGSKVGLGSVEYRMSKAHTHTPGLFLSFYLREGVAGSI